MKVKLVQIGNSVGVRLPKSVIKECGFGEHVMLNVRQKAVILTGVSDVRQDWGRQVAADIELKPVTSAKGEWQW